MKQDELNKLIMNFNDAATELNIALGQLPIEHFGSLFRFTTEYGVELDDGFYFFSTEESNIVPSVSELHVMEEEEDE